MIDAYYWPTPNGWKLSIMLEECEAKYRIVPVDIGGGDQFKPEFLRISPNNRMPAIVDHDPLGGGPPLAIFESGAILEYLAEKTGKFLPTTPRARYRALQWLHWQMAHLGPTVGNANHFKSYAKNLTDDPAQLEYGTRRFVGEANRLCGVMEAQLAANEYLAGGEYTVADIITWPWAFLARRVVEEEVWEKYPNLRRWVQQVGDRPAVEKGRRVGQQLGERKFTEAEEQARRALLFNRSNDEVQAARVAAAKAAAG